MDGRRLLPGLVLGGVAPKLDVDILAAAAGRKARGSTLVHSVGEPFMFATPIGR